METGEKTIGLWGITALTIFLLSIFLFGIPYLLKGFDVYLPQIPLGELKYLGIVILLVVTPFCLYATFFLTKKAGGFPLSRLQGGAPPKLVTTGPYRYVRNPQQLSFFLMLLGVTLYLESISVLIYMIVMQISSHLNVVFVEEPGLVKKFGEDYRRYREEVPRWIPRPRRAVKRSTVMNLTSMVSYALVFLLVLNLVGSVFIAFTNPESYFFGVKLGGVNASLYLLTNGVVGVAVAYALLRKKPVGKFLSVLYLDL